MGRDPRHFQPWSLIEVTCVTLQNRFLLRPSVRLNDLFVGVVARAQSRYGMQVVCLTVLSSHYHLLLIPRDPAHLADFMRFVNTNLSKEIGVLHRWQGVLFDDRYRHVQVSAEGADQIARLKYCLANSVKEGLVDRLDQWPGVHSSQALVTGKPLVGTWYDRTKEYAARQLRSEPDVDEGRFASDEELVFSPLPCWAHLPASSYQRQVAELVEEIESEAEIKRHRTGQISLGVRRVLRMDPHHRPDQVERSPKPRFHARKAKSLRKLYEAWRGVISEFRQASARLLTGERDVAFPEGTFPPIYLSFPSSKR